MVRSYSLGIYSYILIITTFSAAIISFLLYCRRDAKGAFWLFLMEVAVAEWSISIAVEMAAVGENLKYFWSSISYLGTATSALFYFLFALDYYRDHQTIPLKTVFVLSLFPILAIFMAFTNSWHHLLWTNLQIQTDTNIGIYEHGVFFWFFIFYEYILLMSGFILLIKSSFRYNTFYSSQNLVLILASLLPMSGNVMYVFGLNPIPGLDWTPVAFLIMGIILAWGILRLKIFKLVPIARTLLVEKMIDGVILLDIKNQIVNINPACLEIFQRKFKEVIGQNFNQLFLPITEVDNFLLAEKNAQIEIELDDIESHHKFELRLSIIRDRFDKIIGKILVLRDITEQKKIQEEREKLVRKLQEAKNQVKMLSGLLPICTNCKKIRDDQGYWHNVEEYIQKHSEADFTHGICPDCMEKYYPEIAKKVKSHKK
ncbi:MAG: histidine kinase N-terminal 7TM domain-containing protein [Candidatus Marinimicrobia bacterium]|nr:histidine kinase N-terminal 7TM domain-containing protein [Candidatus Neomarinimicrobiota bacterium]